MEGFQINVGLLRARAFSRNKCRVLFWMLELLLIGSFGGVCVCVSWGRNYALSSRSQYFFGIPVVFSPYNAATFCLSGVYVIRSILSRRMRLNTKPESSQSHKKAEVWKPKLDVITIPQGSPYL